MMANETPSVPVHGNSAVCLFLAQGWILSPFLFIDNGLIQCDILLHEWLAKMDFVLLHYIFQLLLISLISN